MSFQQVVASVKVTPISTKEVIVDVTMPFWIRKGEDGKVYITLALLGGLTTFSDSDNPVEVKAAADDAIYAFLVASQLDGKGIEQELSGLGWQKKKNSLRYRTTSTTSMKRRSDSHAAKTNPVLFDTPNLPLSNAMMQTSSGQTKREFAVA